MLTRPLFLTGMMGTGKSSLGRAVADRAGLPFVDLDDAIEARAGMPIARVFDERGETAFRKLERELLDRELADASPRVIALGGGALLDRQMRLWTLERGLVIGLHAEAGEILRRVGTDERRPLLRGGDREARLASILERRAPAYAEVHATVETTRRGLLELTLEVLRLAETDRVAVALGERSYAVEIAEGRAEEALSSALGRLHPSRIVLVTDENVAALAGARLEGAIHAADARAVQVVLPAGEAFKTLASLETVLRAAIEAPIDRQAVLVAVGGGVVTDLGGLAAALALRGIRWVAVPTTTLAMVDASVGGKTAVDLGAAKNAVGAFHQPSHVIVDPTLAATETERAYRSGLAEAVKAALIGSKELWEELVQGGAERLGRREAPELFARALRTAIQVKASIVSRDEREAGERAHLNLGHTLGHALEAEGGFARLTHGEAVALGLVAALRVGVRLGVTEASLEEELTTILAGIGLPSSLAGEPLVRALPFVGYDKKRAGEALRFVLARSPGSVEVVRLSRGRLGELLAG